MKKNNLKDLKNQVKEKKIHASVHSDKVNTKLEKKHSKEEIKEIKKLNKSTKGIIDLKNKPGTIINVNNLTKTYVSGNVLATPLKNINLSIKKGKFIVIIGPSGSGKSTLLNIISGHDRATRGDVIVNNANLSAMTEKQLTSFRRKNIGFVYQSYNLLPSLSVKDNVEMGRILQSDNKKISSEEILTLIGMGDFIKSNIKNISGGQQQRVSIARALAKNPTIIFADEPTAALDQETTKKVIKVFKEINTKYKTTIVLVTHDPQLTSIADETIEVIDGKIVNR